MIRDPLGGWDWDGIRQLSFIAVAIAGLMTLFAAADTNYHWYSPWQRIADTLSAYPEYFIGGAMIALLAIWFVNQFDGGYF